MSKTNKITIWIFAGVGFAFNFIMAYGIYSVCFWTGEYDLGSGYVYYEDSKCIFGPSALKVGKEDNYIRDVPPRILDYNYDKSHIIVKQKPKGAIIQPDFFPGVDSLYYFEYGEDFDYYWIIDKNEHQIYGPYDYTEYKERAIKMGVKLRFENRAP